MLAPCEYLGLYGMQQDALHTTSNKDYSLKMGSAV